MRWLSLPVLIAAALSLRAAQPPNPSTSAQETNASQSIENGIANVAALYDERAERIHRAEYEAQCAKGDNKRDSDLCAQWKAADAAADSARFTYWGNWIGGVSGLLVLVALYAAFKSNSIARDTAKRELRAYISVTPKGVYAIDGDGNTRVPIVVENHGQTPAFKLTITSCFTLQEDPDDYDPREEQAEVRAGLLQTSEGMIAPRVGDHVYVAMPFSLTGSAMREVSDRELAIVHWGVARYIDAFGEARHTYFAHYHWGDELNDANAKRCRFGNDAT